MDTESNASTDSVMEDCVEILVKTDYSDPPRGKENTFDRTMTSFETLVHTALALEGDPRNEHSYACTDKKSALNGMDKDHCYAFCSKLANRWHRKSSSLSYEDLSTDPADTSDRNMLIPFMLPHYRSNDSALDVTGFDTISDKCHSFENINVKTVDVFSEKCILPGLSDPDLSRMTIEGHADETSSSLPNRLQSNMDHSYSQKFKDSFPKNAGVKRGHSNDNINIFDENYVLKRKDFTKSPFLDHSYQAVEWQKIKASPSQEPDRCKYTSNVSSHGTDSSSQTIAGSGKCESDLKTDKDDVMLMTSIAFPNQPFLDHTYEEMSDSTAELPLTDLIIQTRKNSTEGGISLFTENKTDSDHSYVLLQQKDVCDDKCVDGDSLSDSGTESLNEEDSNLSFTNERYVTAYRDHAYVK